MSAGHSQPHLLYSAQGVRAFHVQNGEESEITTSNRQEMQLLMVPTSSPFADLSAADPSSQAPEEDFYLHLQLLPELDQPLPATTQIYHKPPTSYLIPRWDLGPESGAFIRLQFPSIGLGPGKISQDDIDTFETILAQCTAFLERAPLSKDFAPYDPSKYRPGEGYVSSGGGQSSAPHGQIVLIDEENGSVVGELGAGYNLNEGNIQPGHKTPVEIQLPGEGQGNQIEINNVSEQYLAMSRHPAYQKSTIVQTSAKASRLIVTASNTLARTISAGADSYVAKSQPRPEPMKFSPATHERMRQLHSFTSSAVGLSAKTVGQLSRHAQNFGARMGGKNEARTKKGFGKDGKPDSEYKAGILNKSMIAFSTIADGIDHAGRQLLTSGSAAATNVVGHKYGAEAGDAAAKIGGGVKNVGLVYIDAAGVSRRALIKSVAKGMVVGRMPDGQQLVVGGGDGGLMPSQENSLQGDKPQGAAGDYYSGSSQAGVNRPGYGVEGYGAHANRPPSYGNPSVGDPMGSALQGQQYPREKR